LITTIEGEAQGLMNTLKDSEESEKVHVGRDVIEDNSEKIGVLEKEIKQLCGYINNLYSREDNN